jgi:hypothetical protein
MEIPGYYQSVALDRSGSLLSQYGQESSGRIDTSSEARNSLKSAIRDSVHNPIKESTLLCPKFK